MRNVSRLALACAVCSLAVASANGRAAAPAQLAGAWEMNRDLGTAPGSEPGGVDGAGMGRPGARGGRGAGRGPGGGGGGRGPGGGGGGGIGRGGGGGRSGGGPSGGAPSSEDMEARRALMQEVMTLPARMTIAQDGDKVVVIEPDGVVRTTSPPARRRSTSSRTAPSRRGRSGRARSCAWTSRWTIAWRSCARSRSATIHVVSRWPPDVRAGRRTRARSSSTTRSRAKAG